MKAAEFSAALGDVKDAYIQETLTYKPKKKRIYFVRAAVAACLCIAILGGVLAYYKPDEKLDFYTALEKCVGNDVVMPNGLRCEKVPIGDRIGWYWNSWTGVDLEEFEANILQQYVGEKLTITEEGTWYYPVGVKNKEYLIKEDGNGDYTIWRFHCFYGDPQQPEPYTLDQMMALIYGVTSVENIEKIVISPIDIRTPTALEIREQIGVSTYSDRQTIQIIYDAVKNVEWWFAGQHSRLDRTRYSYSFMENFDGIYDDEVVYADRIIEIYLRDGTKVMPFRYDALAGALYTGGFIDSELLTDEEVKVLNNLFVIE